MLREERQPDQAAEGEAQCQWISSAWMRARPAKRTSSRRATDAQRVAPNSRSTVRYWSVPCTEPNRSRRTRTRGIQESSEEGRQQGTQEGTQEGREGRQEAEESACNDAGAHGYPRTGHQQGTGCHQ